VAARRELDHYIESASVVESMLVALHHRQISVCYLLMLSWLPKWFLVHIFGDAKVACFVSGAFALQKQKPHKAC
jgi:hypothetical protein